MAADTKKKAISSSGQVSGFGGGRLLEESILKQQTPTTTDAAKPQDKTDEKEPAH
jgi:hypothetical protein